jgi:carbonic anhydrase
MSVIDEIVAHNRSHARDVELAHLKTEPSRGLVIVACMDARMSFQQTLGLHIGDAHFIRNAGGIVTDDVLRSLVLSHRLLGTRAIMIINHTDCGLMRMSDDEMNRKFRSESGATHEIPFHAFTDLKNNLRTQIVRVKSHPWLKFDEVRGFIYDVKTGLLKEVFESE